MRERKPSAAGPGRALHRECVVRSRYGLHARPAALFVKTAARFASEIEVEHNGVVVSGKSIMGLLTLEGHQGARLTVRAAGADAAAALDALERLFESRFEEE